MRGHGNKIYNYKFNISVALPELCNNALVSYSPLSEPVKEDTIRIREDTTNYKNENILLLSQRRGFEVHKIGEEGSQPKVNYSLHFILSD